MKKLTKAKDSQENEIKDILESVYLLVSKKKYTQAKLILGDISEEDFIKSLPYNMIENTFDFIKTFKKPDWFTYTEKTNVKYIEELVERFNEEKIDISKIEKEGQTLIGCILNKFKITSGYSSSTTLMIALIKELPPESLVKEFIKGTDLFSLGYTGELIDQAKLLIPILNTPEVKRSSAYSDVFSQQSPFINALFDKKSSFIKDFLEINKDFISQDKANTILSTKILRAIFSSAPVSGENKLSFDKLISEKAFRPNIELLDHDFKNAIKTGNIDFEKLDILKQLISENIVDIHNMNTVVEENSTAYERILRIGFRNISHSRSKEERVSKTEELIVKLNEFESLGVLPYFSYDTKESLKNDMKEAFNSCRDYGSSHRGGDVSDEIYEASRTLDLPPFILQNLVDFFDKRYGFKSEAVLGNPLQLKEKEVKEILSDLVDKMVEAPRPEKSTKLTLQ